MMPGSDFASLYVLGGPGLPAQPVKPGDAWKENLDFKLPLGLPGDASTTGISGATKSSLIKVVERAGCRVASLRTTGSMSMPAGPLTMSPDPDNPQMQITLNIKRMLVNIVGTQDLDLTNGRFGKGSAEMKMNMAMSMPVPSVPGEPAANLGISMTGTFHLECTPL
jgi:hypothetical protein